MVRHHLLLPDVATRRDIDDAEEIEAVARSVGDPELLDALHLLCLADARATGPSAHSPWKDGLIAELHARVRAALDSDPTALAAALDPGVAAASAAASAAAPAAALLDGVDPRYAVAAGAEQVEAHAVLAQPPPGVGEVRASWRQGATAGTRVLSVVAPDRRGLLADCAGVLSGRGLRVLDARAFTRPGEDGPALALDWFVVDAAEGTGSAAERAAAEAGVLDDLAAVAVGEVAVVDLVARRERRRGSRAPATAGPIGVAVRFEPGPETTRVEVHGPDAPGVLSRLAAELGAAGLDVVGARVTTLGPEVRDVFFVRTPAEAPEGGWDALGERLVAAAGWASG
jgi:[protein-PII] uridylyltransferase